MNPDWLFFSHQDRLPEKPIDTCVGPVKTIFRSPETMLLRTAR
jgi:hypothetical protein